MKAVTYITENTIMKFLYNHKKTSLEGFVKEGIRFDSGTYQDYGKYVRFLKVAIRDNVSELYMQGYPWGTQKGCKDRPLGYIDNAAKFDRVAVIIDSSKIWPLVGSSSIEAFLAICPELQNILWSNNFLCGFWREFPQRVFEEFHVDESAENNEGVKSLAMQYVIFDALTNSDSPVSFECMLNALKGTCTYERMNDYECAINYGCDPEGCITSMVQWLNDKHLRIVNKETEKGAYLPKKIAAARIAKSIRSSFVPDDNESQRIARSMLAYCKEYIPKRNVIDIAIGDGTSDVIRVKVPVSSFFHYDPETKELFINVSKVPETKRADINRLLKDSGSFVGDDLVPMTFLQEVFFGTLSLWNMDRYSYSANIMKMSLADIFE